MSFLTDLKIKANKLKAGAQVLMLAYRDKRTPVAAKILIGITIGYILSPIDFIPDFIPVLGLLDDLIILPALIVLSIKLIPENSFKRCKGRIKKQSSYIQKEELVLCGDHCCGVGVGGCVCL